jgi:hypothetical protein
MDARQKALSQFYMQLGYKPLNRTWAKAEILLGLFAVGAGLLAGGWGLVKTDLGQEWLAVAAGLVLFILGGYLTLAGHRSHIYQSNNELIAYVMREVNQLKSEGSSEHEHSR